jgi:hypothetical protein
MSINESAVIIVNDILFADITTSLFPGDGDGPGGQRDIDDEDFEDQAEDKDDLHQIEEDNNILDGDDDDHLPDDD